MKNAWAITDPKTGAIIAMGDGHIDTDLIGDGVVVYRDTPAEIQALDAVRHVNCRIAAVETLKVVNTTDRTLQKTRKADCATRFLADMPEPAVVDPADPDAIPSEYMELFDEYWATFDVTTTATDPWHLARLIVQKAQEKGAAELQAASLAEAKLRREKVQAEMTLNQPPVKHPDE